MIKVAWLDRGMPARVELGKRVERGAGGAFAQRHLHSRAVECTEFLDLAVARPGIAACHSSVGKARSLPLAGLDDRPRIAEVGSVGFLLEKSR